MLLRYLKSLIYNSVAELRLSTIELAKQEYQSSQDKSLYGLYVGAESAIKAANETLKAEGKDRKVEIFGNYEAKE